MFLYNLIAPAYDPILRGFYRPFRTQVIEMLPIKSGDVILDLACGTGQNFPYLWPRVGHKGKIVGIDTSSGMLKRAKAWIAQKSAENVSVYKMDARTLSPTTLKAQTGIASVDYVLCTYAFTAMAEDWELAFHRSLSVLKPGGGYIVHDIYAEKMTLRARAVETLTRAHLTRKTWLPLQRVCHDFHMEYLDPSAHIFGGRLFVAYGTKP